MLTRFVRQAPFASVRYGHERVRTRPAAPRSVRMAVRVAEAANEAEYAAARALLEEYAAWSVAAWADDVFFDEVAFARDLAAFPGQCAAVLLALAGTEPVGVVCMKRDADEGACVMARLWVRPSWQRRGVGRALCVAFFAAATQRRYARVRLDSVRRLTAAVALYRSLGFVEVAPFGHVRVWRDSVFLEKALAGADENAAPANL